MTGKEELVFAWIERLSCPMCHVGAESPLSPWIVQEMPTGDLVTATCNACALVVMFDSSLIRNFHSPSPRTLR